MRFFIVDVFAVGPLSGNQLAVFLPEEMLSDEVMQRLAKEMNVSEATFVVPGGPTAGTYGVRIFTPEYEVPFAGHPSLGTAHVIRTELRGGCVDRVDLQLEVGLVPVAFEHPLYWMRQPCPTFGATLPSGAVAEVLGIAEGSIDARFPIQEVSTGLPHILIPVNTLDTLRSIRVSSARYFELIESLWAKNLFVFCQEPRHPENHLSVRMFSEYLGVDEDAATGSGNGCLAAYMLRHRYLGTDKVDVRSEQGHEVGRPSLLHLQAWEAGGDIQVRVGGTAITVARGEFLVPGGQRSRPVCADSPMEG